MHSFLLTRFSQNLSPRRTAFYPQIFLKTQIFHDGTSAWSSSATFLRSAEVGRGSQVALPSISAGPALVMATSHQIVRSGWNALAAAVTSAMTPSQWGN